MADVFSLDWCSFTVSVETEEQVKQCLDKVQFLFGSEFVPVDRGFQGYASSGYILGSGRVAYDLNRLYMGFHVSLPGSALSTLFAILPTYDGFKFLSDLYEWRSSLRFRGQSSANDPTYYIQDLKFTRLDFAFDDLQSAHLDFETVLHHVNEQCLTKRAKNITHWRNVYGPNETLYFGSRSSDTFIRFYNKAAESNVDFHWLRFEMVLKDDRANPLLDLAMASDNPYSVIAEYLYGQIDFKSFDHSGQNKTNWPTSDWWLSFLGISDKLRLSLPKVEKSVTRILEWIMKQVTPSLSLLSKTLSDPDKKKDVLKLLLADGEKRLTKIHKMMIENFKNSNSLELLDLARLLGGYTDEDLDFADYNARLEYSQRKPIFRRPTYQEILDSRLHTQQMIVNGLLKRPVITTLDYSQTIKTLFLLSGA